jgi:TolA-binding protein
MNKLKFIASLLSFTVLLVVSGCYKAPTPNSSRTSTTTTTTTTTATATPAANKSATPKVENSPGGIYQQARSDYDAKNFDKAEAGFKEVLQMEPNHADANFYLGNIYYNQKKYDASLPFFLQASKSDGKSVEKLMALGENQRALKQYETAIVQFQKVIGFEPSNANAYYGLGLTYIGLNNKIGARQQLQKLEPLNKSLAEKLSKEIDGMK